MTDPKYIQLREQRWHEHRSDMHMAAEMAETRFGSLDPAPHRSNYTPPPAPLSRVQGWVITVACGAALVFVGVIGLMQALDVWVQVK